MKSWAENMMDSESAQNLLLDLIEQALREAKNLAVSGVEYQYDSPIELAMATGMCAVRRAMYPDFGFFSLPHTTEEQRANSMSWAAEARRIGNIYPQAIIGSYRVDFLISYRNFTQGLGGVVVECDGHDFHEKTKEQAARDKARDRELQERGYKVFRYAGSEIWRDPLGCARQVLGFAHRTAMECASAMPIRTEVDFVAAYRAMRSPHAN